MTYRIIYDPERHHTKALETWTEHARADQEDNPGAAAQHLAKRKCAYPQKRPAR